jgi:hypothetical protein
VYLPDQKVQYHPAFFLAHADDVLGKLRIDVVAGVRSGIAAAARVYACVYGLRITRSSSRTVIATSAATSRDQHCRSQQNDNLLFLEHSRFPFVTEVRNSREAGNRYCSGARSVRMARFDFISSRWSSMAMRLYDSRQECLFLTKGEKEKLSQNK